MSDQPQPVRTGDVYPPSASAHDARRQRDEVLGTHGGDQQQNQDGDLRSPRPPNHTPETSSPPPRPVHGSRAGRRRGGGDGRGDHRRFRRSWRRRRAGDRPVDSRTRAVQSAETRHGLGAAIPGRSAAAQQAAGDQHEARPRRRTGSG
ncbi:hypothetical protein ZWY2020_030208 [Hordeum vulgare]|nr:hypothetical protein ZWY2020_030208 [Hordeum vulgare]